MGEIELRAAWCGDERDGQPGRHLRLASGIHAIKRWASASGS
jgi:hypothetical protein